MTRENAVNEIKSRWREFYQHDRKNGIICPLCNNGAGSSGTGITSNEAHGKPYSLKCFKCGFAGDIFDLLQEERNTDFIGAMEYATDYLGLIIDEDGAKWRSSVANDRKPAENKKAENRPIERATMQIEHTEPIADYTEYYKECNKRINNKECISYLSARGISAETASAFNLGYDAEWISPTVRKNQERKGNNWLPPSTKRIIMPVSANHYIARAIDKTVEKQYQKMNETGGGSASIFNMQAIYGSGNIFILEGFFDAMSVLEMGVPAIALNSTSNIELLLKELEKKPTKATLILSLDADEAGQKAQTKLADGLKRLNISFICANISGKYKDANDALVNDKEQFYKDILKAWELTADKPDNVSSYIDNLMAGDIEKLKGATEIKTGFADLDARSGGIYPGLYVIAATSSLGKTTFTHQIADNLASSGTDVLFFSMEQSRLELVSKSLARMTKQMSQKQGPAGTIKPTTSLEIRKGQDGAIISLVAQEYKKKVADRLSIIEGNFNCNISFIGDYVRRYCDKNQRKPVVIIDYLQILQPADDSKRATTKETIDNTVTELKRISRELDITIIVISSVNRANYLAPIDFESIKESGGIEYTADVIWGLQLQCLNEPLFSEANKLKEKRGRVRTEKAAIPRKIELVCLKNRYGISSYNCNFDYNPKYDLFEQEHCPFEEKESKPRTRI